MAARRADVLILAVYIFCAFFTIKKASFITEDGISYTFGLDPVYKLNQESYYYSTLWLYKRNCVFARKTTPRNVMFLLLLVAEDIESCPGPKYTCSSCTKTVRKNQKYGSCDTCYTRCHMKCLTDILTDGKESMFCSICHIEEYNEAENVSFINQDFCCFLTSRGLKIVHQNINGIVGKIDKVRLLVADSKQIGIFSITETHLNDTVKNSELKIPGYTIERRDRINGPHGGVICYIRDDLTHQRRSDLD